MNEIIKMIMWLIILMRDSKQKLTLLDLQENCERWTEQDVQGVCRSHSSTAGMFIWLLLEMGIVF